MPKSRQPYPPEFRQRIVELVRKGRTPEEFGRQFEPLAQAMAALDMAIAQGRPIDVIHHSDHGCQYTSLAFGHRCREVGVRASMGSVGDAYDNALRENFFATLECELLDRECFRTQADARLAIFDFIEGWYNPRRRHSGLAYLSPIIFERAHLTGDRTVISESTIARGVLSRYPPPRCYSANPESRPPSTKPGQLHPNARCC